VTALLAACSDSAQTASGGASGAPTTAATRQSGAAATTTSLMPVGEPVNKYTLDVGDCFNRYDSIEVTTRVSCDTPHDREVYFKATYPAPFGQPFPGQDAMQRYGVNVCYEHFQEYVGIIYELSELGIGVIAPTQENFEDEKARYRGITCFLLRNDHQPLAASMRDSRL
jgi:hypothetical protein